MTTPVRAMLRGVWLCLIGGMLPLVAQITETPHTIAPGKVLFEIDGLRLSYDRADAAGNKHTAMAVASTIVSAGITQTFDVQIGADLFLRETVEFRGARDSSSGIGDVSFRIKWTFWRDERRGMALAVIPYVRLPTSTGAVGTDHVEGGFIVPWAKKLGEGVSAGAMLQWDHRRNDANDGYDAHWTLAAFGQRALTKRLSVYGEVELALTSASASSTQGLVGVGALFELTQWLQLDYELLRGVNSRAPEWTHVLRVNWVW